jgi:ABC-type Fe3+-siderophore transport system permease subunit|tara:strand:+ start:147 stop:281 length:135 start_codon:yes stop_codon:yes gene_type:complete
MIEFLRHLTGFCGEPHPSLLTLLLGTPVFSYLIYKIKNKTNENN